MIGPFSGDYRFLSNFYPEPRRKLLTVEHFYQAAKTWDVDERRAIMAAPTPGQAKRLGRNVTLRPDWEDAKNNVMFEHVRSKFHADRTLGEMLLSTGDEELVEVNSWGDVYWGRTPAGVGENHLGDILMFVREELRRG